MSMTTLKVILMTILTSCGGQVQESGQNVEFPRILHEPPIKELESLNSQAEIKKERYLQAFRDSCQSRIPSTNSGEFSEEFLKFYAQKLTDNGFVDNNSLDYLKNPCPNNRQYDAIVSRGNEFLILEYRLDKFWKPSFNLITLNYDSNVSQDVNSITIRKDFLADGVLDAFEYLEREGYCESLSPNASSMLKAFSGNLDNLYLDKDSLKKQLEFKDDLDYILMFPDTYISCYK